MTDSVRQALITSLFPSGGPEKLVVHVKTYQDISHSASSPEDMKGTPRYLCLTQKKSTMRLIKVKKNHKGGFDISKTWSLNDIKQIEIANSHSFSITLNKKYLLFVEKVKEKMIFLAFLIDCCKRSANHMPKLENIDPNRTLMYLADPSAPTLGSSSFYNKTISSSSSLPQRSSTTLVSLNSAHSPLEPVKENPTTEKFSKNEPSSAPPKPTHREFNPPSQKISSVSSENHFYQRSPLREGSTKISVEEEDELSPPQTPLVRTRSTSPRSSSQTWSAYRAHPARTSSSTTFNNRQEEQKPRRSLDGGWQRSYPTKNGMTKAQLMRASIDDWQTRDAYRQQQSFDNTFRRSMDNANSQRRNTMGYPNEELRSPQPNNQNKQSPPLAERPNSREDIPIMADMNRPLSPTVNINTGEPLSPSISPSIKSSHELYNEPETYPEHRASLPPIHPPTNLLRREGTPIYVADRFSRSEANIYNRMDPHSPVPIRKSMDNHQRLLNQELPSESPISKPSPENSLKLDSTPITKNTDGWQAQQGVISSQPRSKTLPTLEKMAEPTSTDDHQEQTFSDTNGDHPKSSTLGNNAASAFKKVDPASKPRDVDTWKPLPSVKPLDEENVSEMESHRISKKNTPPPIPKPRKNLDTKPEEKILIPTQPPAIPARHDIIIANHISGKNSPPPIPKPRQDHQKKEEKILIASQPPPIPFRRDISPNKVSQTTEREEPNMYNKIDTVKRPVRRNIQEAPGSVKEIQHNEEEALLDKQVKKNDFEGTAYCLKGILEHIDKSIAELESMESWLALYGTKGDHVIESV